MEENNMPTGFERGDLFAPAPKNTTDKDDVEQAYTLLLQAKAQMEADEKEIEDLTEALRKARCEISELHERNMILGQEKQLALIQFCNDILTLLSGFGYATPERGYDSPSAALSDLRAVLVQAAKKKETE